MKQTPIPFTTPMVQAILDGRKTQTRRVLKYQPEQCHVETQCSYNSLIRGCPYGQPGDRLWVRETHWLNTGDIGVPAVVYRADNPPLAGKPNAVFPWRPSMLMFRWASRINLELTAVRVERVQDISRDDALAEGVDLSGELFPRINASDKALKLYPKLWDSINGKRKPSKPDVSWAANPWIWVLTFKRI